MTSAQIWPDGTFGVSCLEKRLKEEGFSQMAELSAEEEFFRRSVSEHGLIATLEAVNQGLSVNNLLAEIKEGKQLPPFGLSSVPNSHKRVRGGFGISSYGRQLVRNAAYCLEKKHGKKHLSFLTLTLPTTTTEENVAITENWAEIVRVFVQWLRRRLVAGGLSPEIIACTEIQENRSEWQDGILGLHLHLIFPGRKARSHWLISPLQFREAWMRSVGRFLSNAGGGAYWGAVENVQRVKFSAAAYLGKYLSKGVKAVSRFKALHPSHKLPSAWYNCTAELRHLVLGCKIGGSRAGQILQAVIEQGQVQWFSRLFVASFVTAEGENRICGWYGVLSPEGRRLVGLDSHVKMRVSALANGRAETGS